MEVSVVQHNTSLIVYYCRYIFPLFSFIERRRPRPNFATY